MNNNFIPDEELYRAKMAARLPVNTDVLLDMGKSGTIVEDGGYFYLVKMHDSDQTFAVSTLNIKKVLYEPKVSEEVAQDCKDIGC